MWARALGRLAGVHVPLVGMHHAYVVTERIEGIQVGPARLRIGSSALEDSAASCPPAQSRVRWESPPETPGVQDPPNIPAFSASSAPGEVHIQQLLFLAGLSDYL